MRAPPRSTDGARTALARRPRDAATLVIVDRTTHAPKILMGRRRPDQVFLPGTWVFPGGRVEAADRTLARRHTLPAAECEGLKVAMRGRVSDLRASALALAAVRETYEETGFIIGAPEGDVRPAAGDAWHAFHAEGFAPRLDDLAFFARAITPPGRPRRYDTRFFLVDAARVAHRVERTDGELLDIGWFTVSEAEGLELPSITRRVIGDLATLLERNVAMLSDDVPFYVERHGRLERTLLARAIAPRTV
ncbi:MAG: NUDIX hydrolase [Hyphomicrobium sp.]|uniref:NUDIX hydrolase n=1 Tax=Hyphomicrobium sp. TaxID=82 RepID=UPI003D0F03BD